MKETKNEGRNITDEDAEEIARQIIKVSGEAVYTQLGHGTVAWFKRIIFGVAVFLIGWCMSKGGVKL